LLDRDAWMPLDDLATDAGPKTGGVVVRPLAEHDLAEAARIIRIAFGTFLGAPDLETFRIDRDYAHGRHAAPHVAAWAATLDGALVGSNFATRWGSVGFLGPLSIRPDLQGRGIAQALLKKTMEQFEAWGTRHVGLFTFAHSVKHVALYQKFGFSARFLTAIMSAPALLRPRTGGWSRFGSLTTAKQQEALRACRDVAETIYSGLDLTDEIGTTYAQGLGDTVLVEGEGGLAAFAVCHYGPRSEAGADACYVKFGAARDGPEVARDFVRLIEACEALAVAVGMAKLLVGVNMARCEAYQLVVGRGFLTEVQGVAMHRDNDPGYCRPGSYLIDDWR
jgi:GNAT superfamily N-acetyltransferase